MALLTDSEYAQISQDQKFELTAFKRREKIRILSEYFNDSDTVLDLVDRITDSEFKDPELLKRRLAEIDIVMEGFNPNMFSVMFLSSLALVELGIDHTSFSALAINETFNPSIDLVGRVTNTLLGPLQNDINILKNLDVFESISIADIRNGNVVAGSSNRFNRMLENITQNLKGADQTKAMQALVNYVDATDPTAQSVRSFVETLTGIKPKVDFKLSRAIWGEDKRDEIIKQIIDGANSGKFPSKIKQELEDYLKKSGQGGAYYKAERVVDTELQRAYAKANIESVREWNDQNDVKLVWVRTLSNSHSVPDICDELEGVYFNVNNVPAIPSHPNCSCESNKKFLFDVKNKPLDINKVGKIDGNTYTSKKFGTSTTLI